jgi:hypothetical protein
MKIKLQGGLGNQLFQYAFLHNFLLLDPNLKLVFDTSLVQDRENIVKLTGRCSSGMPQGDSSKKTSRAILMTVRLFAKLKLINIGGLVPIANQKELHEKSEFTYFPVRKISVNDGLSVKGHFQHWKYVENIWPRIENEIFSTLSETHLDTKLIDILGTPTIAVHIRGGDYLIPQISQIYGRLPSSYYRSAIALAMENVQSPTKIIVLTNDLFFAKETISESEYPSVVFMDSGEFSAWQSLKIMSLASAVVTANSTFSWWGGYMCSKRGGIAITPQPWFTSNLAKTETALSHPDFLRVTSGYRMSK